MKNRKGFTLVEVLVALMLVAVAIFAFTPIIVHSFKQISVTGESRAQIYEQREDIEEKIAANASDGTDNVEIIFQNGSDIYSAGAEGKIVSDSGDNIFAFITNTKGEATSLTLLSRTPGYTNKFSEDSWISITDKIVDVTADSELFTDAGNFVITNNNGDVISVTGGFTIDNPTSAYFTLPDYPLSAANSPYKVSYGDSYAYLFVNLTNFEGVEVLATANANRLIFSEAIAGIEPREIMFYDAGGISNNNNVSLNDVVWVPDAASEDNGKFVLVGDNGYYAEIGNTVIEGGDFNEVNMYDKTLLYNLADFTDKKTGVIKNASDIFSVASAGAGSSPLFAGQFGLGVYETYHQNSAFEKNKNGCTFTEYVGAFKIPMDCSLNVGGSDGLKGHWLLYNRFIWVTTYTWVTDEEYQKNIAVYDKNYEYQVYHECKGMTTCNDCGLVDAQLWHSISTEEQEIYDINSVFSLESNKIQVKYDVEYEGEYNFVHITNDVYGNYRRTIAADALNKKFIYWDANSTKPSDESTASTPVASAIGYYENKTKPRMALLTTTNVIFRGASNNYSPVEFPSENPKSIAFAPKGSRNCLWVVAGEGGMLLTIEMTGSSSREPFYITKYIDTIGGVEEEKNIPSSFNFNRVVLVNDRLFAVGDNGLILSSGDGYTWYRHYIYKMVNDEITDEIVTDIDLTSIAGR